MDEEAPALVSERARARLRLLRAGASRAGRARLAERRRRSSAGLSSGTVDEDVASARSVKAVRKLRVLLASEHGREALDRQARVEWARQHNAIHKVVLRRRAATERLRACLSLPPQLNVRLLIHDNDIRAADSQAARAAREASGGASGGSGTGGGGSNSSNSLRTGGKAREGGSGDLQRVTRPIVLVTDLDPTSPLRQCVSPFPLSVGDAILSVNGKGFTFLDEMVKSVFANLEAELEVVRGFADMEVDPQLRDAAENALLEQVVRTTRLTTRAAETLMAAVPTAPPRTRTVVVRPRALSAPGVRRLSSGAIQIPSYITRTTGTIEEGENEDAGEGDEKAAGGGGGHADDEANDRDAQPERTMRRRRLRRRPEPERIDDEDAVEARDDDCVTPAECVVSSKGDESDVASLTDGTEDLSD